MAGVEIPDNQLLSCADTVLYEQGELVGTGVLSVGQEMITWKSGQCLSRAISYSMLSMHAISRDLTVFHKPCVLCILNSTEDAGDGELEEDPLLEIRFVPEQDSQLQTIYSAITEGLSLHPDPDDLSSEDGVGGDEVLGDAEGAALGEGYQSLPDSGVMGGVFTSPDDVINLTPEGLALLHKLDGMLAAPKHLASDPLSQLAPGCVGQSRHTESGCVRGVEMEEGQFDDFTLMDDT